MHYPVERSLTRRQVLARAGGLAAASLAIPGLPRLARADRPILANALDVTLAPTPTQVQILPGAMTNVWNYVGTLNSGRPGSVSPIPGSYLGPIIRARTGDRVRVRVSNQTPEPTITHFHGLEVPADADGHPRDQHAPGTTRNHDFTVLNRAGTYWFHPHTDMATESQVMKGLAGLFLVSDCEEDALDLPRGAHDIPIVLQDRTLDAGNQIVPATMNMSGFFGDRILVNGVNDFAFSAATRVYRFRLLNGSHSRIYKLAWSDGTPLVAIASDGGLLAAPETRNYIMLSPGERLDLWVDLRGKPVGTQLTMRSLPFTTQGLGGGGIPHGSQYDLFRVSVDRVESDAKVLPTTLSSIVRYREQDAVSPAHVIPITHDAIHMWLINNAPFEMEGVAANEIVRLGELHLWEFQNVGSTPIMPHPMHMHGAQFQILERRFVGTAQQQTNYDTVRQGFVESGWKDTFLLMPGEIVRILSRQHKHTGLFVYHCHNLVHEDMGMMRNFRVDA